MKEGKKLKNRVSKEIKEASIVSKEDWWLYTKGIWHIKPDRISNHPASFPIELPKRLIKLYSFKGETVLDPFAGSNTTGYVASKLKRKWISIEKNIDYIKGSKGWFL